MINLNYSKVNLNGSPEFVMLIKRSVFDKKATFNYDYVLIQQIQS